MRFCGPSAHRVSSDTGQFFTRVTRGMASCAVLRLENYFTVEECERYFKDRPRDPTS